MLEFVYINVCLQFLFLILKYSRVRYEFNRPYLEAKDYQDNDALAVEATAYALETIFLMEGIFTSFFLSEFSLFHYINSGSAEEGFFK